MYRISVVLFLLFFLSTAVFSQNAKAVKAYEAGDYEKCLKIVDKAIDKDRNDGPNYIYKALCYAYLAQDKENTDYRTGVTSALRQLRMLNRVDKEGKTLEAYSEKVNEIKAFAYAEGEAFESQGKCDRALRLYDLMIENLQDSRSLYLKGRCLIKDGNKLDGMFAINQAVKNVYLDFKEGKLKEPMLLEGFQDLSMYLIEEGFPEEAFITLTRANELYPNDSLLLTYRDQLLDKAVNNISIYSSDSALLKHAELFERNMEEFGVTEEALEDKWYIIRTFLTNRKLSGDYLGIYAFLMNYVAEDRVTATHDYEKATDYITTEILGEIMVNEVRYDEKVIHFWSDLLIDLNRVPNSELPKMDIIDRVLRKNMELENLDEVGCLLVAYKDDFPDSAQFAQKENEFIDLLLRKYGTYELDAEEQDVLDRWKKYFPENKALNGFHFALYINLIENSLNNEEFSKAGKYLRVAYKLYPENERIELLYKRWIKDDYKENYQASYVDQKEINWNGGIDNCVEGTLSNEVHFKVIQRLNYFRRLAGVPDKSVLSPELNRRCQKAAFMMYANNSLNHTPPKDWSCYTPDGAGAASNSNLSLGSHTSMALEGQLEDAGAGNNSVGHRRWILYPFRRVYGHGSTPSTMALWSLNSKNSNYPDSITTAYKDKMVCWPPEGYVPADLVFQRWSLSYYGAKFDSTVVEVYKNGEPVEVIIESRSAGYGLNTLVWVPDLKRYTDKTATYDVHIKGVKLFRKEELVDIHYKVIALTDEHLK